MNYAEKLKQFNSTEKYKKELEFLKALILMSAKTTDNNLDFGCGTCSVTLEFLGGLKLPVFRGFAIDISSEMLKRISIEAVDDILKDKEFMERNAEKEF